MKFNFATAGSIVFGRGALREVAPAAATLGARGVVITGANPDRARPLLDALRAAKFAFDLFSVPGEPTTHRVEEGAALAREQSSDLVIAIGGGSVIDAGKAIAARATNAAGRLVDYLEVVGSGRPLEQQPLPVIAIPTTAGAGAEVTRNAVLISTEHRQKASLRNAALLPRLAAVDPELTDALPPQLTASTGMDALTQLIEPFVSCRANPFVDALCRDGIPRIARSLQRAWREPGDRAARDDMALASLYGGLALANAGLGAVHGFAAPIGGMFPAPHGAVCAALLGSVMEVNLRALRARCPDSAALERYDEIARLVTGDPGAGAEIGIDWVRSLCDELKIPGLGHYGIGAEHLRVLTEKGAQASSMKANPLALESTELLEILRRSV